jgi:mono/diheme cytochrome c family protein
MSHSLGRVARLAFLGTLLGSHLAGGAGWAQDIGDVAAGRRIASSLCSPCHRIDAQDREPGRVPPDFGAVADMKPQTPTVLRIFLQTPHGNMPRYQMTDAEIDDVIAYIRSLSSR